VAEYKSNVSSTLSDTVQYQQIIDSLKAEISEYKSKHDTMISEKAQKKNTDLQREETFANDNNLFDTPSYLDDEDERILYSLITDIAKLKRNLESMAVF